MAINSENKMKIILPKYLNKIILQNYSMMLLLKIEIYKIQVFLNSVFFILSAIFHTLTCLHPKTSTEVKRGLFMYLVVRFFLECTIKLGLVSGNHPIVLEFLR